jgi:hypothetical protein
MRLHWANLQYLLRHKWFVFIECIRLQVPLWIAILHDLDKFLPDVWLPYARIHAPDARNRDQLNAAFAQAKMIHQHRCKHHWQFWVYINDCGTFDCLPIPDVFRRELLADWRGAAKSMGKPDLVGWYASCRETMRFHPETRTWIEQQLGYESVYQ